MAVEIDDDTDISLEGADMLSDKFGWCVNSFKYEALPGLTEKLSVTIIKEASMSWQMRTDVRYVVKDEHTLGYVFDAQPGLMGVLSSKKARHDPHGGPVPITFSEIRPATVEDFETFRVKVPPDFKAEQDNKPQGQSRPGM